MDIKQADLGLLIALDALLAKCNVTRAAEQLNISQPAMSAQLARLRDLFDDPLLVQSGRKMVPTARAEKLQGPLHRKLRELTQLVRERTPFDPSNTSRVFRIIAPDYLHQVVTLPLVAAVNELAPNVQIAMLPFERSTAWRSLETLGADLLVVWHDLTPEEAKAAPLFEEELCFVQRKRHPRGLKKLTISNLCRYPHAIIAPEPGMMWGVVDEELKKRGKKRRIVASVSSFLSLPTLLSQSDLVAAIPRRLAHGTGVKLDSFALPFSLRKYQMLLSWHPRMQADPGHQWLRNLATAPFKGRSQT